MLAWILIFTFIGSGASLLIAALLLFRGSFAQKRAHWLVAFAAGAMLAAAFFDLLPEALREATNPEIVSNLVFLGIVGFFFLERFLLWHHHHAYPEGEKCEVTKPGTTLVIVGDGLHNFLDGVTIAAAFLISFQLGVVTSLAVFFHEIPHEVGNFGVLLSWGMKKKRVLIFNIFSGLLAFVGAGLAFCFLSSVAAAIPYLVAFAAGNFIYIATSDLIPELHQHFRKETALSQTLSFIGGILIILGAIRIFAS